MKKEMKKKIGIYVFLIIGIIGLFVPLQIGVRKEYLQVLGVIVIMLSLYLISSGLTSKKDNPPVTNDNLKL